MIIINIIFYYYYIDLLADELITGIALFLDIQSLLQLSVCNKRFHQLLGCSVLNYNSTCTKNNRNRYTTPTPGDTHQDEESTYDDGAGEDSNFNNHWLWKMLYKRDFSRTLCLCRIKNNNNNNGDVITKYKTTFHQLNNTWKQPSIEVTNYPSLLPCFLASPVILTVLISI